MATLPNWPQLAQGQTSANVKALQYLPWSQYFHGRHLRQWNKVCSSKLPIQERAGGRWCGEVGNTVFPDYHRKCPHSE